MADTINQNAENFSGRSVSVHRQLISWAMLVVFPLSLFAADTNSAVLRSKGGVWVNGSEVADSTAVFPGDVIETKPGSVANLDAEGSSVLIQPQTIVKFQGDFLALDHGSIAVGTSTSMSVHVNCLRVVPITNDRTQYEVADVSGRVEVAARKLDVNITQSGALHKTSGEKSSSSQSATVHEGQHASSEESQACGAARPESPENHPFNTKWIEIGGGAAAGGVVLCLLLCKGSPQPNSSPSQP